MKNKENNKKQLHNRVDKTKKATYSGKNKFSEEKVGKTREQIEKLRRLLNDDKKVFNENERKRLFNKIKVLSLAEAKENLKKEKKTYTNNSLDNKNINQKNYKAYNGKRNIKNKDEDLNYRKNKDSKETRKYKNKETNNDSNKIRLNKFIANAGICSRREADKLIVSGAIKVNGVVVTQLGVKVSSDDIVMYGDQRISGEKKRYILLNKPKGYITTTDDPHGRNTVMELVKNACSERIYPIGRLDRNTTGLLLFTNDGELAKKLTHPKHKVVKVYNVELDKALKMGDMKKIIEGIDIEDEKIFVDAIEYIGDGKDKKKIGIEIHSGQNRIVRKIFESFGYKVRKLDRVRFANLTKKNLPRGQWRFLTQEEVNILKRIN